MPLAFPFEPRHHVKVKDQTNAWSFTLVGAEGLEPPTPSV